MLVRWITARQVNSFLLQLLNIVWELFCCFFIREKCSIRLCWFLSITAHKMCHLFSYLFGKMSVHLLPEDILVFFFFERKYILVWFDPLFKQALDDGISGCNTKLVMRRNNQWAGISDDWLIGCTGHLHIYFLKLPELLHWQIYYTIKGKSNESHFITYDFYSSTYGMSWRHALIEYLDCLLDYVQVVN